MESTVNFGQELGLNLKKIVKKLCSNQNLCNLLVNTSMDPLNENFNSNIGLEEIYNHNIFVKPYVEALEQNTTSKLVIIFTQSFVEKNTDMENLNMSIYIYCPFVEWEIKGDQLRPFAIMSEIRKSLQGRRINGLGEINYHGFEITSLTEQMGSYLMRFSINAFN